MQVKTARLPLYATGLALVVATAVTGCATSSSSSSSASAVKSSAPPAVTPLDALKLAAQTSHSANSFTGTMNMQMTVKPGAASATGATGDISMTATFAERLHPSLLARVSIGSFSVQGTSLPGGMSGFTEIITPTAFYLKWAYLTQSLHLTKPWLVMSYSALSKNSGINVSQLMNQAASNSPLAQSQMLAGATSVRQAGTGTIGGVPVTEYTGTLPLDKAVSYLSGSVKTQVEQQIAAAGFTNETFTVWIDGQHITRKAIVTVAGKSMTETMTMTITSINQPVKVAVPPASQTSPMPTNLG